MRHAKLKAMPDEAERTAPMHFRTRGSACPPASCLNLSPQSRNTVRPPTPPASFVCLGLPESRNHQHLVRLGRVYLLSTSAPCTTAALRVDDCLRPAGALHHGRRHAQTMSACACIVSVSARKHSP